MFPNAPGASISVASTKNGYLYAPDNNKINNVRITVKAAGNFSIGTGASTSPSVTVALYPVSFKGNVPTGAVTIGGQTTAPYTGATAIISQTFTGASDLTVGGYPWTLLCDLQGDNTSGLLQAVSGSICIDGTAGTFTASVPLSSVSMNSPVPFGFVVGVTFSVSDSGATANMYQFQMES